MELCRLAAICSLSPAVCGKYTPGTRGHGTDADASEFECAGRSAASGERQDAVHAQHEHRAVAGSIPPCQPAGNCHGPNSDGRNRIVDAADKLEHAESICCKDEQHQRHVSNGQPPALTIGKARPAGTGRAATGMGPNNDEVRGHHGGHDAFYAWNANGWGHDTDRTGRARATDAVSPTDAPSHGPEAADLPAAADSLDAGPQAASGATAATDAQPALATDA